MEAWCLWRSDVDVTPTHTHPELELWRGYEELNSGPLQEHVFLNT